ncbi:DUF6968 family protein [Streptomyces sp. WM6378]|uniref:DUF6968 family protein n=1 Tax=Streptomyces sp. WM6378 TaxID=1415557 RepID=UPI0006AEB05A|nr:hypothetical protein [Streptomyces sp. WM6378]KOU33972.1 hypothetical protein ADK54_41420 [Streptomyces sp. WM6378]
MTLAPPDGTLGRTIASRTYEFTDTTGIQQQVTVHIGAPRQDPGGDWYCPCQILGRPQTPETVTSMWGVDSLQALILALSRIRGELGDGRAAELTWYGNPDLGLDLSLRP